MTDTMTGIQAMPHRTPQPRKRDTKGLSRNHYIASAAATRCAGSSPLAASGAVLGVAVVQASGRPKGSVHRMLATLVNTGFLVQDPKTSRYSMTLKLWRLGASYVGRLDAVKVAQPWLERLVAEADETVHMSVLDADDRVSYISRVESMRSIRVQTRIGQVSPAYCTATGRSILAYRPAVAERVLAGPIEARTPRTVTDPKRIRAALREVADAGYAVLRGENHPEVGGIGAPIRDYSGAVIAAIGLGIPAFRMNRELVARCVPMVVRSAAGISADLGYRASEAAAAVS